MHFLQQRRIIIIISSKAICNAKDPLTKAANVLSCSEKMLLSLYNVSYKQQCLQLCAEGRETTGRHSQHSIDLQFTIADCSFLIWLCLFLVR